ncbi:MAG: YfhO family protein [Ruminococcus sp.]|nr:YfhO family protein [Ruminococcus sp.]
MAKSKAVSAKPGFTAADVMDRELGKKSSPWIYVAAFFIPAILTLIAYAAFGVFPFGERSVLALDLNGQYIYYFEALRDAFWGDGSIFYSWGRDLSGEFMGIIGYYLASPFTLIVMLLPRTMILESILIMQLCKLGTAGLTFCIYAQKSKHVKPLQSILFSTVYAMMGYAVIQLIDPMWIDGVVFLPLIILGVERLVDDGRKINYIIPLAIMFIANFYIGYMVAIFVAMYFLYYLFFGTERRFKDTYEYVKVIGRMFLATAVVLMCSAIMLLPVYNALSLGKFEFSQPDYSYATQFSPIELVPTLLPNQYYSVNMHGKPEIYCGVLSLVLLPLFYLNKKVSRNQKIGYTLIVLALFFSMYIKPVDMLWHGGQTPNWLPYRYSFLLSFVLVSMAATIFSNLDGYKLNIKQIGGTFVGILALVLLFEAKMDSFEYQQGKFKYVASAPYTTEESFGGEQYTELWLGTLAFGMLLAAFYLFMLYLYSNSKNTKHKRVITFAMAAVVCFEAGYNAYDTFKKVDKEVAFSNRDTYYNIMQAGRDVTETLEEHDDGLYRAEKTFFRTVNDNLTYGLRGISHSSSVMNTKIINFIETMGYSMRSYVTRYDGNSSLADSLLGIKYIIHDPRQTNNKSILNTTYNQIFTEDYINNEGNQSTFQVYENPNALSIGYMVSEDITNLGHLGNDNPFNSQNIFMSTLSGNTQFSTTPATETQSEIINIDGFREYYTRLPETIVLNECVESPYGEQRLFTANADATNPLVNVQVQAQNDDEIYMYFKTYNEKAVNLWISSEKDENGNFINHSQLSSNAYYENHDYCAVRLGSYPAGTDIEIRMTIRLNSAAPDTEEYTIVKDFFVYHFNDALFQEDIDKLKTNQWDITEYTDRYIEGTITAEEGQIMFTSIPSEPGWTVKVDGKKVEQVELISAFIGIPLEPGTHTVTMEYTPPGFIIGVILLILGIGAIVLFYLYDRKNNKVLIAAIKAKKQAKINKERAAQGLPAIEETPEVPQQKKPSIIKSKGAPAAKEEEKTENSDSESQQEENAPEQSNNAPAANNQPKKKKGKKKKKR